MRYPAIITQEGDATLAEFPDCPGCQTFSRPGDNDGGIEFMATEALEGWLESTLLADEEFPVPSSVQPPEGGSVIWIDVPARLAIRYGLREARKKAGLTQAQLAERADMTQQQIARIEGADSNPTIELLDRVARALGVSITLEPMQKSA